MNNNYTTFYIVRHGESEWNVKELVQGPGPGDTSLTEKGRQQAAQIRDALKEIRFDTIITSDAKRARETAEIIAGGKRLPVQINNRLHERAFGKYVGWPVDKFLALYKDFDSLTPEQKFHYKLDENEESFAEAYDRFSSVLFAVSSENPGETVLIVTHAGMIRGLLIKNGYGDFNSVGGIDNCGFMKVICGGNEYRVDQVVGLKTWHQDHPNLKTH